MKGLGRIYRKIFPEILVSIALKNYGNNSGIFLMYHEVQPESFELPAWTVVKESDFKWQIEYLTKRFDVLSIDEGLERVYKGKKGNKPFAVISFDDGYKGNLDVVLPFMEKKGIPFVVYIATKGTYQNKLFWYDLLIFRILSIENETFIEFNTNNRKYSIRIPYNCNNETRWEQLEKLLSFLKAMPISERENILKKILRDIDSEKIAIKMLNKDELKKISKSSCVTIGNHTHSHELLDKLNKKDIQITINKARENIESITGLTPLHFSYPNGNYNYEVANIVERSGYRSAVTTKNGLFTRKTNRLHIPRLCIGRFESKNSFKAKISGFLS